MPRRNAPDGGAVLPPRRSFRVYAAQGVCSRGLGARAQVPWGSESEMNMAEAGVLLKTLAHLQAGERGVLEGCRAAVRLIWALPPEIARSEAARALVGVASEVDDLALGPQAEGLTLAEQARAATEADALVDRLSAEEQLPAEPDYWRRRALNWLYDHRDDVIDPLGVVEELYAHFGYPEDMASFVRYMPPVDWTPQPGRPAENLAHLMRAWARFNAGAPSADE